jgi:hypothetical protein
MFRLILISILLSTSLLAKQSMGKIKGKITARESKEVLIGVSVSLLNTNLGSVSNESGEFEIDELPAGSYQLKFEYVGYVSYIQADVIVKPARSTELNISLALDQYSSETVLVTASYYETNLAEPIRVVSFSPEEIRRSPGAGGELSRILSAMPSVTSRGEDSQDIIVRGGSPVENYFLVNNIPVPSVRHFETATGHSNGPIGLINTALVSDVKFSSGGFGAEYGGFLSSVTDIKYKDGNSEGFAGEVGIDFTGFNILLESPIKNGSYFISARRSYLDLVADQIGESGAPRFEDVQGKINYNLNDNSTLTFLGIYGNSEFDDTDLDNAIENDKIDLVFAGSKQLTLGSNWTQFWSKSLHSNTSLSYSTRLQELSITSLQLEPTAKNDDRYDEFNLRHVSTVQLAQDSRLSLGFDVKYEEGTFNYFFAADTLATGQINQQIDVVDKIDGTQFGAFVSINTRLAKSLNMQFGLRANYNSYNEDVDLAPRLNLSYQLNSRSSLNAAYGVSYQRIPLFMLSQLPNQSNVKSMQATQFVLGYDYLLSPDTKLTLESFYKVYENMPLNPKNDPNFAPIYPLDTRFGQSFAFIESTGEGKSYGVEVLLQKKLAVDFYGMVSGSYFRSQYKDQFGTWQDREFDNKYVFNIIGGYKPNDIWEYSVRWSLIGGKPDTPIDVAASTANGYEVRNMNRFNNSRFDAYHSLYLRVDRRFNFEKSNVVAYLTIWNAYGNENINRYFWNPDKQKIVKDVGFSTIPVVGVKYEF